MQGPKAESGHADVRSLSFDGQSAAAAARSGVPLDLMTIAARVDAGSFPHLSQHVIHEALLQVAHWSEFCRA